MSETLGLAPQRDVILQTNRCKPQEFVRTNWVATVESHVTREDMMTPRFWSNVAVQFRQFDRIDVRQDDGKFYAEYLILNADKTSAYLKELIWVDLTDNEVKTKEAEFKYQWRGPHAKHSIVRTRDGSVMVEKLDARVDAEKWLANYLETI